VGAGFWQLLPWLRGCRPRIVRKFGVDFRLFADFGWNLPAQPGAAKHREHKEDGLLLRKVQLSTGIFLRAFKREYTRRIMF
jgi:hypothetical protein